MARKGTRRRRTTRTKTICTGGSCFVCRPIKKPSKVAYKKCIVNALKGQKFVSAKSARKAFARAAKKCRGLTGRTTVRKRKSTKRRRTTRKYTPRGRASGGIPRSWQKRRAMSGIRPDLW